MFHFETGIEEAVQAFASSLPAGARMLDAGAGEGSYKSYFAKQRYTGTDLAVGDAAWDYSSLDVLADLTAAPFADGRFDAAINIVTLEHVREPAQVIRELGRVLRPGGKLLLVVPLEWEEHQTPHDFFRYTRYGVQHLLEQAGFDSIDCAPVGGFFRLLARRMLNALQFFSGFWFGLAAIFFVPVGLILPWFDGLDRHKNFTLGFICTARRRER